MSHVLTAYRHGGKPLRRYPGPIMAQSVQWTADQGCGTGVMARLARALTVSAHSGGQAYMLAFVRSG